MLNGFYLWKKIMEKLKKGDIVYVFDLDERYFKELNNKIYKIDLVLNNGLTAWLIDFPFCISYENLLLLYRREQCHLNLNMEI